MCTPNPWCCEISQTGVRTKTDSDSALCQGCTKLVSETLLSGITSYKGCGFLLGKPPEAEGNQHWQQQGEVGRN